MLTETSRSEQFPLLNQMTYLNTAAEGIPPLAVGAAYQDYFKDLQFGMDGRRAHYARHAALRESAGRLLGLCADEIGIRSCTSEAYNLVSMAIQLQSGDEVVINDLDYPAGTTPMDAASFSRHGQDLALPGKAPFESKTCCRFLGRAHGSSALRWSASTTASRSRWPPLSTQFGSTRPPSSLSM